MIQTWSAILTLALGMADGFEPSRDLADFATAASSEWADVYDLDHFLTLKGKVFSSTDLDRVRRDWDASTAASRKRIEELKGFEKAVRDQSAKDRFLSSVPFTSQRRRGVFYFVQQPPKPDPTYSNRVEEFYRPYLDGLVRHFESTYATPLGLERRKGFPAIALFILASEGAYDDYARTNPEMSRSGGQIAHYNPALRFALTFEPGTAAATMPDRQRRQTVCHESVHALVDDYARFGSEKIASIWLQEGFAEYVSSSVGDPKDGTLKFGAFTKDDLSEYESSMSVASLRDVIFPPLQDLLAAKSYEGIADATEKRASARSVTLTDENRLEAIVFFYKASQLFVQFLHEGEGGRFRDAFMRYFKSALAGRDGTEELATALGIQGWSDLEQRFRFFVDDLIAERTGKPRPTRPANLAPSDPSPAAPATLELSPPTPAEAMASALRLAKAGDVFGAVEAARKAGGDPDDLAFLESLLKLSDDLLDTVKKSGKNFSIKGAAGGVGTIERFDGKQIVLVTYDKKQKALPRSAFTPKQLVDWIRDKSMTVGTPELIASIRVLTGEAVSAATKSTPDASAVVQKRAERWAASDRLGDARERIERLVPCATNLPPDPTSAIRDVDALMGPLRNTEVSIRCRAALLDLGTRLLDKQSEREVIGDSLSGFKAQVKRLPKGDVEIHYDFAKPEELSDFGSEKEYVKDVLVSVVDPAKIVEANGTWNVSKGIVTTAGSGSLFHRAQLTDNCSLEASIRFASQTEVEGRPSVLLLGICDDGEGSFCAVGMGALKVVNVKPKGESFKQFDPGQIAIGQTCAIKIEHVGTEFVLSIDGAVKARTADLGVRSGRAFFVVQGGSDYEISKVVVRGKVDPNDIQRRRQAWIAEKRTHWDKGS